MFKAKVQVVLWAAFASTGVSVLLGSQTESVERHFKSPMEHLQIRVFNDARVRRRDLSRAEREVARIFAEADMGVLWAEGALDDSASLITDFSASNTLTTGCKVASHARDVSIRLLPHAPRGVTTGTLGFSLPCAAFGIDSTIFVDNCEAVTYPGSALFGKVLAYAIAHELGHLLLRSSEHSQTGLMRARWDKAAWIRATVEGIPIDREQARRMRVEFSRMASQWATRDSR